MTELTYCDECDNGGWCEAHYETVAIREGASTRTADELRHVFVLDAIELGVELAPWGLDVLTRYGAALEANRSPHSGVAWLSDDNDEFEGLVLDMGALIDQVEADLSTLGLCLWREDGYVIYRDVQRHA